MVTKQDFTDGLRRALNGRISPQEVEEHIRYYDEYITAEMRMGKLEADVLAMLGDPRLIAMSICAANEAETGVGTDSADSKYQHVNEGYQEYQEGGSTTEGTSKRDGRPFILRHPKLAIALIIAAVLVVIILFIGLVFSLLQFLWPVILVVVIIVLVARLVAYIRER